jgi:hypothetical protein
MPMKLAAWTQRESASFFWAQMFVKLSSATYVNAWGARTLMGIKPHNAAE